MFFKVIAGIFRLAGLTGLCFILAGCLVSRDEYNKAKLERDEVMARLHETRTNNEVSATLIHKAYAERAILLVKLNGADRAFSAARDEAASKREAPTESGRPARGRSR